MKDREEKNIMKIEQKKLIMWMWRNKMTIINTKCQAAEAFLYGSIGGGGGRRKTDERKIGGGGRRVD